MAERSFAKEVEHLKIGAGETFRGEGILAITKALLENGVGYVAGYQGSPISHLMDVLADAQEILSELGVHFEASASEATAAATAAADRGSVLRRLKAIELAILWPLGLRRWTGAAMEMVASCPPESGPRGAGGVPYWTQGLRDYN